jgi:sugar lactone lactonase YvrE
VAALRHVIAYCECRQWSGRDHAYLETELTGNRFNDGAVDPRGRFWFGSMDMAEAASTETFYCVDSDTSVRAAFDGNHLLQRPGLESRWRTTYHVDSIRRLFRAYDFDAEAGIIGPGRDFISDEAESWFPDGVTVDADGFVWNCRWDGGRIVRYAPDGSVDRVALLPVPRPTRCADLSALAVTSATIGLDATAIAIARAPARCSCWTPTAAGYRRRPSADDGGDQRRREEGRSACGPR